VGKSTSLSLDDHFSDFIESQVSEGRYSNASDVMHAGLRLLEEHETKLAALRSALAEGEQSGVGKRDVRDIWRVVEEEFRGTPNGWLRPVGQSGPGHREHRS